MINNRTVCAIVCLHFGKDYLSYAMRSVLPVVDQFVIAYSPVPNHGHFDTSVPCPDTREDLFSAAESVGVDTTWIEHDGWRSEGEQFKTGWTYTDADVIVKLDADEIWTPKLLESAIAYGLYMGVHEVRVPLVHAWRSLYRGFAHDPAAPGRIYLRENKTGETTFAPNDLAYRIFHAGYALPVDLMRYKERTHGHKAEWRRDVDWINDVYAANRQYDCHPVGSDYWQTVEDITPPDILKNHPFAQLEVIP